MRITLGCAFLVAVMTTAPAAQTPPQTVVAGRNVNMVSGTTWPTGDPFLQRQNEPSVAVSTRNPLHVLAGANDYRTVDMPGVIDYTETGDAWLGVFKSFDGGQRWQSTLIHGYPLDVVPSPLAGYAAGADPVVRAGAHGLFFYSGLVFDRGPTGKSAVFVSRFIDNNNLEAGDPIAYLGTSIVASDTGATSRFLDKPWMAVDIPRSTSSTCVIPATDTTAAQTIQAGTIYVAYTALTTSGSALASEILLTSSTDCGVTWNTPVRVSRTQDALNQGATIAIDPSTGDVYVAWRRLSVAGGADSDAFLVARSMNQGRKFSTPGVARRFPRGRKVGLSLERYFEHQRLTEANEASPVAEFDQGTSEDWLSFRTNAYPSMTFDGEGRLYLVWTERGFGTARPGDTLGDARIVMTTTQNGSGFTPPRAVDETGQLGHQVMPTITYANGRLLLVYYDLRLDVSQVFGQYIDDASAVLVTQPDGTRRRHTIDIRATTAAPGAAPEFAPSTLVSEYAHGTPPAETGPARQLQHNVPNLPLFRLGTVPFMGDYIDVAAAPMFVLGADGRWQYNTAATASPVFHGVWTDNRDVRPPTSRDGSGMPDWTKYTKPGDPNYSVCEAGTRNQNIYTSRLTTGLIAGSPGNTKPLTMDFPRAFVVFAQNTTEQPRYFRFTIVNQPPGGRASFLEYPVPPYASDAPPPLTQIDVAVPRRSAVARTVYATSTDPKARITVDVAEIAAAGAASPLPDGLRSAVVLNPDISNPDISNPDISNPDISNPDISNAEVHNPDISNPDISNPDISNPDISNPDISNPDISNPDISNPDISNPDISNPDISNPDISNPDISNPDISNPDISNGSITDVSWTVTNTGNTTTAFDVKLFFSTLDSVPDGIKLQLILHRLYKTPLANGCDLKEQTHNVLIASILNPDISNPDISNQPEQAAAAKSMGAQQAAATDPETPTLWLEPGGKAKITLRIVDTDRTDNNKLDPTEIAPEIKSQPKNTEDLPDPDVEPPKATPEPAPDVPLLAFMVQPADTPAGDPLPEVVVSVSLNGVGVAGVPVILAFAENPVGAKLLGTTIATSDGDGLAHFTGLQVTKEGTGFRFAASSGSKDAVPALSDLFVSRPAALVVLNTNDTGHGSLRQAILDANGTPGADIIRFDIAAGPFVITPASALPAITSPVVIDGTSQPGYAGTPIIELNGALAGEAVTGLRLMASGSTVRGLVIRRFGGWGVSINGTSANLVERSYIGTDAAGAAPGPGNAGGGIVVIGSSANTIRNNLISANGGVGVSLVSATTHTYVEGNLVGTTAAGGPAAGMGNGGSGISISENGTANNTVRGNTVALSGFQGIDIVRNADHTLVVGNFVGTNSAGAAGLGNNHNGVRVEDGAHDNTIGGPTPAERNVISGNGITGVTLARGPLGPATWGNLIQGNYIGTTPAGDAARPNAGYGMSISDASVTDVLQNVISGNGGTGVWIGSNTAATAIRGNHIGTNAGGTAALPNDKGVEVAPGAGGPEIGGLAAADRNVISGNTTWGIGINHDVSGTRIQGNYIGTNETGSAPIGNGRGLVVFGPATTIGGLVPAARNVISGNAGLGIELAGATPVGSAVRGNYIGLDATGTSSLANGGNGVYISSLSTGITIGGDEAGAGNVVSGNAWAGIMVYGSSNTIQGNTVGLNAVGAAALANGGHGIAVDGASGTTVAGNLVSGNSGDGIALTGAVTNTQVEDNVVGVAADRETRRGNAWSGVSLDGAGVTANTITRNIVAANTRHGVHIRGGAHHNTLTANRLGTNAGGDDIGNILAGLRIENASGNVIGGPGAGNVIYDNGSGGVVLQGAANTSMQGNSVYANGGTGILIEDSVDNVIGGNPQAGRHNSVMNNSGIGIDVTGASMRNEFRQNIIAYNVGLGIDLAGDGVTPNDPGDADVGANGLQNYPELAWADNSVVLGKTTVQLTFTSTPNTTFTLQFYANAMCAPPARPAQEVATAAVVATDGTGTFSGTLEISPFIPSGQGITATATGPDGTSEVSACVPVIGGTPLSFTVLNTNDSGPGSFRQTILDANSHPGPDFITFSAGTGPVTISPVSGLPEITDRVVVDATTQPGYAGAPIVELEGSHAPMGVFGLYFNSAVPGSVVRGLVINRYSSGINIAGAGGVTVAGNYVGTNVAGTAALTPMGECVYISDSPNNRIGGADDADRNVLSGSLTVGNPAVAIYGAASTNNQVVGNYIGTTADGLTAFPATSKGVLTGNTTSSNVIQGNLIDGQAQGGVWISGTNNVVRGNRIGVDVTGTHASPNSTGIWVVNAQQTTIGGNTDADRNIISGNSLAGIALQDATNTLIKRNYIGTDAGGIVAVPNGQYGVNIFGGTGTRVEQNLISGNGSYGVYVSAAEGTIIKGNSIGTTVDGHAALGNMNGIQVVNGSTGTIIGDTERNLISGNTYAGVTIDQAGNNQILNNYVGTNAEGTGEVPNGAYGLVFRNATLNTASGNVIAGHHAEVRAGVIIYASSGQSSSGNVVASNHIGLNAAGTLALPNTTGVRIENESFNNRIFGNVISGNIEYGVSLKLGAHDNIVAGNKIGTNAVGTLAIPNSGGVLVDDAPNNVIGGPVEADRNVIAGNTWSGVQIMLWNAQGTLVQGNYIGTTVDGGSPLGNAVGVLVTNTSNIRVENNVVSGNNGTGVDLSGFTTASRVSYNRIGTNPDATAAVANTGLGVSIGGPSTSGNEIRGNVISGNGSSGVELRVGAASNNVLFNMIGRGTDAMVAIPNGQHGVFVSSGTNNTIGSESALGQNSIGYNLGDGVRIALGATGNTVLGNGIFSNGGLGINRMGGGPPAPALTSAVVFGGGTTVNGTVNLGGPLPGVRLRIEFFDSVSCDGSGGGEGQVYLGFLETITNDEGVGIISLHLPFEVPIGHVITATTVTGVSGGETSVFSACRPVILG